MLMHYKLCLRWLSSTVLTDHYRQVAGVADPARVDQTVIAQERRKSRRAMLLRLTC